MATWRRLGAPHQCRPTRAFGVAHAHLVAADTEFWCPECHRLWVKTSNHRAIGRRSVCGCGWLLVGTFTNAEALERFYGRLRAEYERAGVVADSLQPGDIARIIREDRESH